MFKCQDQGDPSGRRSAAPRPARLRCFSCNSAPFHGRSLPRAGSPSLLLLLPIPTHGLNRLKSHLPDLLAIFNRQVSRPLSSAESDSSVLPWLRLRQFPTARLTQQPPPMCLVDIRYLDGRVTNFKHSYLVIRKERKLAIRPRRCQPGLEQAAGSIIAQWSAI